MKHPHKEYWSIGVLECWINGSGFLTSMENNPVYLGGSFLAYVCGVFGFPLLHHSNTRILPGSFGVYPGGTIYPLPFSLTHSGNFSIVLPVKNNVLSHYVPGSEEEPEAIEMACGGPMYF